MTVDVIDRRRHKKVRELYFGAWVLIKFYYKMFNKPWETSGDPGRALIWDGVPVLFFCFCLGMSKCPKFQTAQPCIERDAMF